MLPKILLVTSRVLFVLLKAYDWKGRPEMLFWLLLSEQPYFIILQMKWLLFILKFITCFLPLHLLEDSFIPSFIISSLIRASADSHVFAFVSTCSIFFDSSHIGSFTLFKRQVIVKLFLQLLVPFSFSWWARPARSSSRFAFMSYYL